MSKGFSRVSCNWDNVEELMRRPLTPWMRSVFACAEIGAYVETAKDADGHAQGGTIVGILRDRYGIPACFEVAGCSPEEARASHKFSDLDYIPATAIVFYEPYSVWYSHPELDDWEHKDLPDGFTEEKYERFAELYMKDHRTEAEEKEYSEFAAAGYEM